jgi:abhydrolase domain-containing protein 5
MAEEIGRVSGETPSSSSSVSQSRWAWPSVLRWIPTSTERIIAAEKRLLSLVKYITYIIILDFLLSVEIFFFS